jgi:hypothetical protein
MISESAYNKHSLAAKQAEQAFASNPDDKELKELVIKHHKRAMATSPESELIKYHKEKLHRLGIK